MISSGSISAGSTPPAVRAVMAWQPGVVSFAAAPSRAERSRFYARQPAASPIGLKPSVIASTVVSASAHWITWLASFARTSASERLRLQARRFDTCQHLRHAARLVPSSITSIRATSSGPQRVRNAALLAQLKGLISIMTSLYAFDGSVGPATAHGTPASRSMAPSRPLSNAVRRWEQFTGLTAVLDGRL